MSLAVKYRPKKLIDVIGNKQTVRALEAALEGKAEFPHTVLLSGPAGCGKTTLARIIARALKCSFHDFCELNTADFRGIDTARDLCRQARQMPMNGPVRVWLLDECHKLTNDAQNALLKILEEPPAHAYFILATTEPEKLIGTVRSRCTAFTVQPLGDDDLACVLSHICEGEGAEVPDEVTAQIIQDALGSSRAAISVLQRVIGLPRDEMLAAAKEESAKQNEAIDLCRLLFKKSPWKIVGPTLAKIDTDPEQVRRMVLGYCQSILLKSDQPRAYVVMDAFRKPTYDIGKPGITMAAYECCQ